MPAEWRHNLGVRPDVDGQAPAAADAELVGLAVAAW